MVIGLDWTKASRSAKDLLFANEVNITNEAEYDAAVAEVKRLFGAAQGTPEAERFSFLASLVEAYEKEHFLIGAPSEAAAADYARE